jgi:uracil-DNA glycosylase
MLGDWTKLINLENVKPILSMLNKEYRQYTVFPPKNLVFEAFRQCPVDSVRVVIIGQDPYPQKGYATGIAFANPKEIKEISPSLSILRDRVFRDYGVLNNEFDQTLISWEKQGVLLLNAALTVRENCPGSHTHYWVPFIESLIRALNETHPGLIYVCLGKVAEKYIKYIGPSNHVLKYPHPAYYCRLGCGFEATMFLDINKILKELNNDTIKF